MAYKIWTQAICNFIPKVLKLLSNIGSIKPTRVTTETACSLVPGSMDAVMEWIEFLKGKKKKFTSVTLTKLMAILLLLSESNLWADHFCGSCVWKEFFQVLKSMEGDLSPTTRCWWVHMHLLGLLFLIIILYSLYHRRPHNSTSFITEFSELLSIICPTTIQL